MSGRQVLLARSDGDCRLTLAEQLGDTLHLRFESGYSMLTEPACLIHDYRLDAEAAAQLLEQLRLDYGPWTTLVSVLKTEFETRCFTDRLHDYLTFYAIRHEFHSEKEMI